MGLSRQRFGTKCLPVFFLLTCLAFAILSYSVEEAYANVPSVVQIENLSQGSMIRGRITIRHANPSSSHYVDQVEVAARAGDQTYSGIFPLQLQSSDPFSVELGENVTGRLPAGGLGYIYVKVRARCNLHGWSDWSSEVQVPEFGHLASIVVVALAASLLILNKKRSRT